MGGVEHVCFKTHILYPDRLYVIALRGLYRCALGPFADVSSVRGRVEDRWCPDVVFHDVIGLSWQLYISFKTYPASSTSAYQWAYKIPSPDLIGDQITPLP